MQEEEVVVVGQLRELVVQVAAALEAFLHKTQAQLTQAVVVVVVGVLSSVVQAVAEL